MDGRKQSRGHDESKQLQGKKFKGVRLRSEGRWVAEIKDTTKNVRIWLGTFDSPVAAALAYDEAARQLRGSNARTNFRPPLHAGEIGGSGYQSYFTGASETNSQGALEDLGRNFQYSEAGNYNSVHARSGHLSADISPIPVFSDVSEQSCMGPEPELSSDSFPQSSTYLSPPISNPQQHYSSGILRQYPADQARSKPDQDLYLQNPVNLTLNPGHGNPTTATSAWNMESQPSSVYNNEAQTSTPYFEAGNYRQQGFAQEFSSGQLLQASFPEEFESESNSSIFSTNPCASPFFNGISAIAGFTKDHIHPMANSFCKADSDSPQNFPQSAVHESQGKYAVFREEEPSRHPLLSLANLPCRLMNFNHFAGLFGHGNQQESQPATSGDLQPSEEASGSTYLGQEEEMWFEKDGGILQEPEEDTRVNLSAGGDAWEGERDELQQGVEATQMQPSGCEELNMEGCDDIFENGEAKELGLGTPISSDQLESLLHTLNDSVMSEFESRKRLAEMESALLGLNEGSSQIFLESDPLFQTGPLSASDCLNPAQMESEMSSALAEIPQESRTFFSDSNHFRSLSLNDEADLDWIESDEENLNSMEEFTEGEAAASEAQLPSELTFECEESETLPP